MFRSLSVRFVQVKLNSTSRQGIRTQFRYQSRSKPSRTMGLGNQPNEPEWMALPSGACCLKGHLHSGKPKGTFEQVKDLETYVARPSPEKANGNVIIYYPDVFGFFTNGLLIMDEMADAGYLTIGIDYFQGVSCTMLCVPCQSSAHQTRILYTYTEMVRSSQKQTSTLRSG